MSVIRIDETTGSGSTPYDVQFNNDAVYVHVFVALTKEPLASGHEDAIKESIRGYLESDPRNMDCATQRAFCNIEKAETGTPFVRVTVHQGAILTDEQAAALDAQASAE